MKEKKALTNSDQTNPRQTHMDKLNLDAIIRHFFETIHILEPNNKCE